MKAYQARKADETTKVAPSDEWLPRFISYNMETHNYTIAEGLELERKMAYSVGNVLVKIWFKNDYKDCRLADFVQGFKTVPEAREATIFLKEMRGVAACYIVRLKPKYQLLERVVSFN